MINLSPFFYLLAHLLVGCFFCFAGFFNIKNFEKLLQEMENKKIPLARILLMIGIGYESLFGLMLVFGILIPFAALMLVPFTIIAVCMFHTFWKYEGEKRQSNFVLFFTNMTVTLGALFLLMCVV